VLSVRGSTRGAGKFISVYTVTSHPGQLSLAIPPWVGAKGGDALQLGSKGRYGS